MDDFMLLCKCLGATRVPSALSHRFVALLCPIISRSSSVMHLALMHSKTTVSDRSFPCSVVLTGEMISNGTEDHLPAENPLNTARPRVIYATLFLLSPEE